MSNLWLPLLMALMSAPTTLAECYRPEYWVAVCEDGATINSVDVMLGDTLGWFKVSCHS